MRKGRKKECGNSNPMEGRARPGWSWGMQEKGGGEEGKRGSEGVNREM